MAPPEPTQRQTLRIKQGATFRMAGTVRAGGLPYPWTGTEVARMMLRPDFDTDPLVTLTTAPGGGITLGPEPGRIRAVIPASHTRALPGDSSGVFDLEVDFPPGEGESEPDTRRPLEGDYEVDREVTR